MSTWCRFLAELVPVGPWNSRKTTSVTNVTVMIALTLKASLLATRLLTRQTTADIMQVQVYTQLTVSVAYPLPPTLCPTVFTVVKYGVYSRPNVTKVHVLIRAKLVVSLF